ncbi:MAG: phage tail protein, partial [Oxalobacter formigenes]|nr:phage tail protein [Oxalobacter formigenes]
MKRIDTTTAVPDMFGPGKSGWKNGNKAQGIPATEFNADWPNNVQEEICNVIEAAGITLDGSNRAQLLQAIRGIIAGGLATEKVAGIARIATAEEAEAGEDNATIITPAKLANALKNISTLPVSFMTMWPSATLPADGKWMERNGDILQIADYPDLFAILGNLYGGNGTTTFALPDDRGLVERGWDHGRGYDSARTFGSEQEDAIRNIVGTMVCTAACTREGTYGLPEKFY